MWKKKKKKFKTDFFFFTKPIMVNCLNIGKNIGKPIYRSISSKNSNIVKYYNLKWLNSNFQSSVSRDPSEIILICWFAALEKFIIIISVLLLIFAKTIILFSGFCDEIEIFCNIVNNFTVTFDQFNASFLKKSLHLLYYIHIYLVISYI